MKSLGEIIKNRRLDLNLTLDQLAQLIDSTKSYLSRLENNRIERPSTDILKRLSKQLDISYNQLIIHSGYMDKDSLDLPKPKDYNGNLQTSKIIMIKEEDIWIENKKLSDYEKQRFLKMVKLFYDLD